MPDVGQTVFLEANFGPAHTGLATVQFRIREHTAAQALVLDWTSVGVYEVGAGEYALDHVFTSAGIYEFSARTAPGGIETDDGVVEIEPATTTAVTPSGAVVVGGESSGPLPYLSYCGVEVANAARTLSYLRNGLASSLSGHWEFGSDVCGVLYRVVTGTCVPFTFVDPASDPAPWYKAAEPGSASFLGVVLLSITGYDSTNQRTVTPSINDLGGGRFGSQYRKPREWRFRAALISADDAGAEYGLRWLTAKLRATECDTCATCEMVVRLTCPPANCSDDTQGEWLAYSTALVEGPTEVDPFSPGGLPDALGGCRDWVTVEWTVTSGNPLLYKRPVTCVADGLISVAPCADICEFLTREPPDPVCCEVTRPGLGTTGLIVTLTTPGSDAAYEGSVVIDGHMYASMGGPPGLQCPFGSNAYDPDLRMELSGVPPDSTVVVDSSRHRITVTTYDPITGQTTVSDGEHLLVIPSGEDINWLEIRDCEVFDTACFCVRAGNPCAPGSVTVALATQRREG